MNRRAKSSRSRARTGSDLDAFRRYREEIPPSSSALGRALDELPVSDDPAITFAGLARACVPAFADGCSVELSDEGDRGGEISPLFRAVFPPEPTVPERVSSEGTRKERPDAFSHTPFQGPSRAGYRSYAGVITHWWALREPSESDVMAAELMTRYAVAQVDRERLTASAARVDERVSEVVLSAIAGRTINIAIGIVMSQHAISPGEAEHMLRQEGRATGSNLYGVASRVVHAAGLASSPGPEAPAEAAGRGRLRPVRSPGPQGSGGPR